MQTLTQRKAKAKAQTQNKIETCRKRDSRGFRFFVKKMRKTTERMQHLTNKKNTLLKRKEPLDDDTTGIRTRKVRFTGGGFAFPTPDTDEKPARKRQSTGRDAIIVEGKHGHGLTHTNTLTPESLEKRKKTKRTPADGMPDPSQKPGKPSKPSKQKQKQSKPAPIIVEAPEKVEVQEKVSTQKAVAETVSEVRPMQMDVTATEVPQAAAVPAQENATAGNTKKKKKKKTTPVAEPIVTEAGSVEDTEPTKTTPVEEAPAVDPLENGEEMIEQTIQELVANTTEKAKAKKKKKKKKAATIPDEAAQPAPQPTKKAQNGDKGIECRFSYSGRGFGFAVPVDPADSVGSDIFISPRATQGAMTGDVVLVRLIRRPGIKNGSTVHSVEGEVVGFRERTVEAITGKLTVAADYAMVKPDNDKLRVLVYVPLADCDMLGAKNGDKVEVVPDGEPCFTRSRSITITRRQSKGFPEEEMPFFDTKGRLATLFGSGTSREANYASILHASGIRTEFPPYVKRAAKAAAEQPLTYVGRVDLRDQIIMTIDGADAKDLDDAISLRKNAEGDWVLGVHIADVSHYVPYDSCVEKEARVRGTSVYFTDKVIPMLPEELSNGACSLNAGTDKYALTCEITLDPNGQRKKVEIYKSILRSAVRGVYSEVNRLLDNASLLGNQSLGNQLLDIGEPEAALVEKYRLVLPMLRELHTLYGVLYKRASDRGAMELADAEAQIVLGADGYPVEILRRERGDAEKIIEQCMLQANMAVAETLRKLELPCLYRVHDTPDKEKLRGFAIYAHNLGLPTFGLTADNGSEEVGLTEKLMGIIAEANRRGIGDIVSSMLLRSMMKAKYVATPGAHFGLGAETYCHFTSPIRRYPDLFVHNVLTAVLPYTDNGRLRADTSLPPEAFPQTLATAAPERGISSSETEINAQQAEWKIEDLYMALYMADKVGQIFDVTVVSVMKFGLFVQCENLVEGMIPTPLFPDAVVNEAFCTLRSCGALYTLGTKMQARLVEADPASGRITFAPLQTV